MSINIEKKCFDIYKSIKPEFLKALIPTIDLIRKFKKKPPIPKLEKMAEIDYPDLGDRVIMVHGVSVGEIQSLENLIKRIKNDYPDYKLIVTTGTVTGQELAHKKYSGLADFITYFPLDIYSTCDKFIKALKPNVILIAETELWPNFSYACKQNNVPLYIINGRISDKSYPSYLKIKKFLSIILKNYSGIFCQSEVDMKRFIEIGSDKSTTCVMKNLKFEIIKKECDIELKTENKKVFVAGSTHQGEDEIVIRAYKKLKTKVDNLVLLLAPRHLTRLDDIKKLLDKEKLDYGLRTNNDTFLDKDIIILDTLGELSKVYDLSYVTFIGGSFNNTGGHNPLESVIYSKPVISGPSIKNFRDIYSILVREKASFVVKNEIEFYQKLQSLFCDEKYYNEISSNCGKCFRNQQGALDFVIYKLNEILK